MFQPDGHVRGLYNNRYVCFSFHGIWTIMDKILQIPYLTLKIQYQYPDENRPKSNLLLLLLCAITTGRFDFESNMIKQTLLYL